MPVIVERVRRVSHFSPCEWCSEMTTLEARVRRGVVVNWVTCCSACVAELPLNNLA